MKISIISAGKSITSGRDYHWNDDIIPVGIQPMQAVLNEQSGKYYSLVIASDAPGIYSVFMARLPLVSGDRDDLGRPLCAGILVQELNNSEARQLAIEYMQNRELVRQMLCSPAVIQTGADFSVNLAAAQAAVCELLKGATALGQLAPLPGEVWGESFTGERTPDLIRRLTAHRLSERPENRIILCYFTDTEKLTGDEDLVLHYSPLGTYTKTLTRRRGNGLCDKAKRFLPGFPDDPKMQLLVGVIAFVAAAFLTNRLLSGNGKKH